MATSGALADFGRMPTQRKVMVFVVIGVLLGLLYWKFVYSSLKEELEAAEQQHESKVQTNRKLAEDIPRYQELITHVAKLRELIEKNQTALPSEAELAAFIETLQHKVTQAGVETRKWTYKTPEPVETFVKVPFEVEVTGTFMQIKKFFASLVQRDVRLSQSDEDRADEDRDRIVSIENLKISDPEVVNHELVLHAKFTATTYREEAPPEEPVRAKAAPAPAKGAKLAPADTPQGAKQRLDDSMKKDESRTRSAPGNPAEDSSGSAKLKGGVP